MPLQWESETIAPVAFMRLFARAFQTSPLLCILLLLLNLCPAKAEEAPTVRVLFVGNSYTYFNNMPDMFDAMCASTGLLKPLVGSVTDGGLNLADHVRRNDLAIALTNGARSDGKPWDVLVLQHQSVLSASAAVDPAGLTSWAQAAATITSMARQRNPNILIVLFETWARHPKVWETGKADVPLMGPNPEVMHQRVRSSVQAVFNAVQSQIAETQSRILISPVGDFWQQSRSSLPAIELFNDDGTHPNPTGSWLTALTILGTIGGRDCIQKCDWTGDIPVQKTKQLKSLLLDHPEIFSNAAKP